MTSLPSLQRGDGGSLLFRFALALLLGAVASAETVTPLVRAHAHNDYRHARPLLDALDNGFCSVEADIWLVDGKLLVAHDRDEVQPGRTLEQLYLGPLKQRVALNGGKVYPNGPGFTLLIDIKSDGATTWGVLKEILAQHAGMLTRFSDAGLEEGAVTVILSGDVPRDLVWADATRLAGVDGRLKDLGVETRPGRTPLISDNWLTNFTWRGAGPLPEAEATRLKQIVDTAHAHGQQVRFWALPLGAGTWNAIYDAGVDLINADNLDGLQKFLIGKMSR